MVESMNSFTQSITNSFTGAIRAIERFPAAILSALAFTIVTMVRIQLDWPQQEPYNFLFHCLHWAFALSAVFSIAAITAAQSRIQNKSAFLTANLLGAAAAIITFFTIFVWGEAHTDISVRYAIVSDLAAARVSAAILISFFLFILAADYPKERSDFARSFFMTHKAFFIALLYGIVIMAGTSGVAGAVQALLYHEMSGKVYMYLGSLTGFLAFTIFLGYFPDFRKGTLDEHRDIAQKQPRFIEILFGHILVPILLALTVVLFLWSGRTILTGTWPVFMQLAGIATSYSLIGLWLHIMVTHHESGLTTFYRRFYPFAALVILAFEAGALFSQLEKYGLKVAEYWFILVWILAVAANILLLVFKAKAHHVIVALICALALFSVLPLVGYHAMPVTAQVHRLERILEVQGMLKNHKLIPAVEKPELSIRESITDTVYYLANTDEGKLPDWFNENLNESDIFKAKLGFEPVWPKGDSDDGTFLGTSLYLKQDAVDVSDYKWAILSPDEEVSIKGMKGTYSINWKVNSADTVPALKIKLGERTILEEDMNDYLDQIASKFPPGHQGNSQEASLKDMSLVFENKEIAVYLIFNNIQISVDPLQDHINYWVDLDAIYLKEKL